MLAVLCLAAALALPPSDSAVLLVRVLDVSDARIGGDAILITDSAGGRARHVLIDASDRGATVIAHLRRFQVDTLAAVILSHPHADHYGGMAEGLERFPARPLVYGGTPRSARTYRALLADIDRLGIPVVTADTGVRRVVLVTADDSIVLTILAPPATCEALPVSAGGDEINNCSIGVRLERRGFTMLFPGDAEVAELEWWILTRRGLLAADVLKASHHDGDVSVVEIDGRALLDLPRWLLPTGARGDDVLSVTVEAGSERTVITVARDAAETEQAKAAGRRAVERLKPKDPGGDLVL